jgi:transcriptional regulator with XRE-family HTH domain
MGKQDDEARLAIMRLAGARLREAREAHGLSQAELSEEVKKLDGSISPSAIGNYEQGTRMFKLQQATLFGKVLGVAPAFLLLAEGEDVHLSDEEVALIKNYRAIPLEDRNTVEKLVTSLSRTSGAPPKGPASPAPKRPKR